MSVPVSSVVDPRDLLEERELVERAQRDPEAFGRLYERYRVRVYKFACARLRHPNDAEDVTSEVFLRALRAIGRYRYTGVPFRTWLFQIAANVIVDQLRRRRPVEDIDEHLELAAADNVEDLVARRDLVRRIRLAARPLPASQRTALALRFGHDLAVGEIADRMGRSEGAVKLLLHRAQRVVRAAIPAEAGDLELAS